MVNNRLCELLSSLVNLSPSISASLAIPSKPTAFFHQPQNFFLMAISDCCESHYSERIAIALYAHAICFILPWSRTGSHPTTLKDKERKCPSKSSYIGQSAVQTSEYHRLWFQLLRNLMCEGHTSMCRYNTSIKPKTQRLNHRGYNQATRRLVSAREVIPRQ